MPQNIILLNEACEDKWNCSFKIGNLYINWLAIDEDAANEILNIDLLAQSSEKACDRSQANFKKSYADRLMKFGQDYIPFERMVKKFIDHKCTDMEDHLIVSSRFYCAESRSISLCQNISNFLNVHNIDKLTLTLIHMWQSSIQTKEDVDRCYLPNGKKYHGSRFKLNKKDDSNDTTVTIQPFQEQNYFNYFKKAKGLKENALHSVKFYKINEEESVVSKNDFYSYCREYVTCADQHFENHQKDFELSESSSKYALMICSQRSYLLKNQKFSWTEDHMKFLNDRKQTETRKTRSSKNKKKRQ